MFPNTFSEAKESVSAMLPLHDLVKVFTLGISSAGESFQCLLVSAMLQKHVSRQESAALSQGWRCPVTCSGSSSIQSSPSRWSPRQLGSTEPWEAASRQIGDVQMLKAIDVGDFCES